MKNSWQILTLLLAVAVVILSANQIFMNSGEVDEVVVQENSEVVFNNIITRSSVRSYTPQKIDTEIVEKLLRAGMAAPTAGNRQPWEFIVVTDRKILDTFPTIIPASNMATNAQLAIVVAGTPAKALIPEYWVQDCSAVTENILLAAHGFGLGAVWCGAYPENGSGRVEAMRRLLNIPNGTYALNIIVVGYPDSEPVVKDKWDIAKIHYNRY